MAAKGYRLKSCGAFWYTFERCLPDKYAYAVAFVADKSQAEAKAYREYLEYLGFRVWTKNINLNFSIGKIRWRPFAKGWGQLATSPGTYNQELFIAEKKNDGQPFVLHSDLRDLILSVRTIRNAYRWAVICMLGLLAATFLPCIRTASVSSVWAHAGRAAIGIAGIAFALPAAKYSTIIGRMEEESQTFE